ncbi:hypothetical protein P153DRAFT_346576 [Dothidotthia symphoricarpi CBS 119687]|uniref:Mis12-Mtw1 family protein n=1 Tax=Dothidotthia symphoricarpi CBS 119687 TaxID=1392245 RepID=A0A6A6A7J9_9PLEO|nr:uncharacterized protein P153DRAFT_346576 [Dothidotthia symphoricarpi CBS 119687]KAF2126621.1 hypothetical protein P153DRAFT_346576 [Dothidotthia symphoricarpi CBS 119687]
MTTIFARSPLESLPMAANRPTTRRRSVRQAFDEEDVVVSKRAKVEGPGTAKRGAAAKASAVAKKAAKTAAYDENDDGFQFSRRTSKRTTKTQISLTAPEPIPEEPRAPAALPLPAKPSARRKKDTLAVVEPDSADSQKRRRSARISGDREQLEVRPKVTQPLAPKRTKKSAPVEKAREKKQITPAPEEKSAFSGVQTPQHGTQVATKRDPNAQRIMLPFADTPVITRNKEMRKGGKDGHRRSSTGLRGRRASSLIDSGTSNALPHSEIEVRDFYKYIEQSLPEPRRMKQLLTWCGTRALPEKPSGDVKNANAIMAARAIQQELIDDFASKTELSDWFSREDVAPPPAVTKPNPQNEKNMATLQELEEEIKRLEQEHTAWQTLASPQDHSQPSHPTTTQTISPSLLDPSQQSILAALSPQPHPQSQSHPPPPSTTFTYSHPSALSAHLASLTASLEPAIDLFAHGVHAIDQYRLTAERVADRVLGTATRRLEERERGARERVGAQGIGVGDVLRGLAGVLGGEV